jgi:phosphoribosylamine--glycine ligase
VPITANDFQKLAAFCIDHKVELVVVGPEGPLVNGIRDYFEADARLKNTLLVGPGKAGAQLEGSKDFSKQFMVRHGIPTARAKTFQVHQLTEGLRYLESCSTPIVLKADGLAAGKGVIISPSIPEAQQTLREMLEEKKFGDASAKVLIEEFLEGIEVSVFVLTDGSDYVILPEAKDYKRIGEGDRGPNTGGMGAASPVVFADATFMKKVEDRVIRPTVAGLKKENIPYKGFIFVGLISVKGEPFAAATGALKGSKVEQESFYAVTVVLVSGGYPGDYQTGNVISGLEKSDRALVFHAGTQQEGETVVTTGGRVLAVTGRGVDLKEASINAYEGISGIGWDKVYFRKDIGLDLQNWSN